MFESALPAHPGDAAPSWEAKVEAAGLASLLVAIDARMGSSLKARHTPEDVLQEVLIQAWRDRDSCLASTPRELRSWLLSIVDHRLSDLADHDGALKRGGGRSPVPLGGGGSQSVPGYMPAVSTTPSQVASRREQARAMREALAALPDDVRDIVRLRVFEQMELAQIAERTGLHLSSVFRRFRKGLTAYHAHLRTALASSPGVTVPPRPKTAGADSSPTSGTDPRPEG